MSQRMPLRPESFSEGDSVAFLVLASTLICQFRHDFGTEDPADHRALCVDGNTDTGRRRDCRIECLAEIAAGGEQRTSGRRRLRKSASRAQTFDAGHVDPSLWTSVVRDHENPLAQFETQSLQFVLDGRTDRVKRNLVGSTERQSPIAAIASDESGDKIVAGAANTSRGAATC